jgi:hypothetical protein
MDHQVTESRKYPGHWHVEAVGDDGQVCVVVFSGPGAKERAYEYADFKNKGRQLPADRSARN